MVYYQSFGEVQHANFCSLIFTDLQHWFAGLKFRTLFVVGFMVGSAPGSFKPLYEILNFSFNLVIKVYTIYTNCCEDAVQD
jgi:hypothetical protein